MANRPCAAITRAGGRCLRIASEGSSFCYGHAPERSEERRRNAEKAGKIGGNGRPSAASEVSKARALTKGILSRLLSGVLTRDTATASFMGINTLARLVELERRIIEQDEIEERLAALEARQAEGGGSWTNAR